MTTEAITFELGGINLSLPDASGLQPLMMPSLDSVARFNTAMQSVTPEATPETTSASAPANTAVLLQTLSVAVPTAEAEACDVGAEGDVGAEDCSALRPNNALTAANSVVSGSTTPVATTNTTVVEQPAVAANPTPVGVTDTPVVEQPAVASNPTPVVTQSVWATEQPAVTQKPAVASANTPNTTPVVAPTITQMPTSAVIADTPVAEQHVVTPNSTPVVVSAQNVVTEQPTPVVTTAPQTPITPVAAPVVKTDDDDDEGAIVTEQSSQMGTAQTVAAQPQVLQASPVTVAPSAVSLEVSEAVVASTAAFTAVQINEIAEAVAAQIRVEPALTAGDATVKIELKPTVLEGSQISLSAQSGALAVEITPASHAVVEAIQNALPRLEAALASHVAEFHSFTVSMRKERKNEVA
jgi:flagellar hook-length control protein FliK